jgi:hypothetical protein
VPASLICRGFLERLGHIWFSWTFCVVVDLLHVNIHRGKYTFGRKYGPDRCAKFGHQGTAFNSRERVMSQNGIHCTTTSTVSLDTLQRYCSHMFHEGVPTKIPVVDISKSKVEKAKETHLVSCPVHSPTFIQNMTFLKGQNMTICYVQKQISPRVRTRAQHQWSRSIKISSIQKDFSGIFFFYASGLINWFAGLKSLGLVWC